MEERASTAARVRQLREQAGLDIIGLAFKSGVNPRTIERIETGDTPDPRRGTLVLLAIALGVDPAEFGVRAPEAA